MTTDMLRAPLDRSDGRPAAYYIAQESFTNVQRHAGAGHCRLRLALASPATGEGLTLAAADAVGAAPRGRPV